MTEEKDFTELLIEKANWHAAGIKPVIEEAKKEEPVEETEKEKEEEVNEDEVTFTLDDLYEVAANLSNDQLMFHIAKILEFAEIIEGADKVIEEAKGEITHEDFLAEAVSYLFSDEVMEEGKDEQDSSEE